MKLILNLFKYKFCFNYSLLISVLLKTLLVLFIFGGLNGVHCLYEDQVSKFDWRLQFVGQLKQLSLIKSGKTSAHLWQTHNTIIFSTESHVLTSLHIRNGTIKWRHLLESDIEALVATDAENCPLMTINGFGTWIRCWSLDGLIISERSLSTELIQEIENNR